jgi:hypothetical protein
LKSRFNPYWFRISAFSKVGDPFSFMELLATWFEKVTFSSIVGAVSGAAGQLHKSVYQAGQGDRE